MKKRMNFFAIIISMILIFLITNPITLRADFGPKPSVTVDVVGAEGIKYTITLISQNAFGPNRTYEEWQEYDGEEYHEIMEYKDSEGYMWIGRHQELNGNGQFKWGYYPPRNFKILILTSDGKYYSSKVFDTYAFHSYYKVDLSRLTFDEARDIGSIDSVKNNYKYAPEILSFFLRLIFTITIELMLALLFSYRSKRHIKIILIVNVITQLFLNISLNLLTYYEGILIALIFYILFEIMITLGEAIFYTVIFKKEGSLKAFLYGLIANIVSFGVGIGIYALIY